LGVDDYYAQLTSNPGFLLSRVGAVVQEGFKELLAGWKLRPQEFFVLMLLNVAVNGTSQQQLCQASGFDSGNMVEFIDELEALRYATRRRDPDDRRRHIVTITPAGRSALAKIIDATEHYNDTFLSSLTPTERQRLSLTLAKLYAGTPEGRPRGQRDEKNDR
jgi:DNA-binding MarR family transcriptional regulator